MRPFLHQRLRSLEQLQADCSAVLIKYNQVDLDLANALAGFIDAAVASYRSLNLASTENQLLALQAQTVSAAHGIHPDTLERTVGHRRELQRAVALRVLQLCSRQLRDDIDRCHQTLADARSQLLPLVLVAIDRGLVPMSALQQPDPTQIESLWRALLGIAEVQLAARRLAMQIALPDLHLLLGDLVNAARGDS